MQIVSFHCVLKNKLGKVISSTFNQDVITEPLEGSAEKDHLRGLVDGLKNLKKGEKRQIMLTASEAYGFYDPSLVIEVSRKSIFQSRNIQIGSEVLAQAPNGENKVFRVIQILGGKLVLDANHPLAGQDLIFDIEATEARDASPEELLDHAEMIAQGRHLH